MCGVVMHYVVVRESWAQCIPMAPTKLTVACIRVMVSVNVRIC